MLVSLLSIYLGFGADLPRGEVSTRLEWINRLISSQFITYFHRFTFEQVYVEFVSPLTGRNIRTFSRILRFEKYPETPNLNLTVAKKL
jgi:hypothetical protein